MSNPRRLCAADACLFLHEKSEGVMLFPASFRKTGAALFKAAFFCASFRQSRRAGARGQDIFLLCIRKAVHFYSEIFLRYRYEQGLGVFFAPLNHPGRGLYFS
ncbi:hypothetical protein [uncultured Mailhella sp.]|uniref:hypothetical protein n=1 Tax=uncultured Mailhella sp. TaxID=1981031 RepID=UPI0025ED9A14|nr:hypothetical protein [uncultured Mailhella sp.]